MIIMHRHLRWLDLFILWLFSIHLHIIEIHSTGHVLYSRTRRDLFEQRNRDGDLPTFPLQTDLRLKSFYIFNAHEVLRKALQQYLEFKELDLGSYLSHLIYKRTEPFKDEYGQDIRNYKKVFRFIWEQHNETLVQNYAIKQFDKDKLYLCSVARYLSHQPNVEQRGTIMKRMGDALEYRCHPCTPYTPKEHDKTAVPSTDGINPAGVSPEESFILCQAASSGAFLRNAHGYCLSSTTTSNDNFEQDASQNNNILIQEDCDQPQKGKYWSWNEEISGSSDRHLCNGHKKCVAAPANYNGNINLIQWEHLNENGQRFNFFDLNTSGIFMIMNDHGKCLGIEENSKDIMARAWALNCNPSDNGQRWKWQPHNPGK